MATAIPLLAVVVGVAELEEALAEPWADTQPPATDTEAVTIRGM